jgi:hypothetical protein
MGDFEWLERVVVGVNEDENGHREVRRGYRRKGESSGG